MIRVVALTLLGFVLGACASGETTSAGRGPHPPPPETEASPPRNARGSDINVLADAFPHAAWVPLAMQHTSLIVSVLINGVSTEAILDTGAQCSSMDLKTAAPLALKPVPGAPKQRMLDASGTEATGITGRADSVRIGAFDFGPTDFCVLDRSLLGGRVLLGLDVLRRADLFILPDAYSIGFFPPGAAPRFSGEQTLALTWDERERTLLATFANAAQDFTVAAAVDTGATFTTLDVRVGLKARLSTEVRSVQRGHSLSGTTERRGHFALKRALVAGVDVGALEVQPWSNAFAGALLGLDIWLSYRTVISAHDAQIRIHRRARRPAQRLTQLGNVACTNSYGAEVPCVDVRVQRRGAEPQLCYAIAGIDGRVELAVRLFDDEDREVSSRGGGIVIQAKGAMHRGCLSERGPLRGVLGVAHRVELVWVRTPVLQWRCGSTDGCLQTF